MQQVGPSATPPGQTAAGLVPPAQNTAVLQQGSAGSADAASTLLAILPQPGSQPLQGSPAFDSSSAEAAPHGAVMSVGTWQPTFSEAENAFSVDNQRSTLQIDLSVAARSELQKQPGSAWADFTPSDNSIVITSPETILKSSFPAEGSAAAGSVGDSPSHENWIESIPEQEASKTGPVADLPFPLLLPKREPPLPPPAAATAAQKQKPPADDAQSAPAFAADQPAIQFVQTEVAHGRTAPPTLQDATATWQPMSLVDKDKCRRAFREKVGL